MLFMEFLVLSFLKQQKLQNSLFLMQVSLTMPTLLSFNNKCNLIENSKYF